MHLSEEKRQHPGDSDNSRGRCGYIKLTPLALECGGSPQASCTFTKSALNAQCIALAPVPLGALSAIVFVMSAPKPTFTYRLAFRPADEQMTSAELASTVQRVLLSLSDDKHGVTIVKIHRPPRQDGNGLYLEAVAYGPERWYLDADDYLLSQGLRTELQP